MPRRRSTLGHPKKKFGQTKEQKMLEEWIAHSELPAWWRGKSWYQIKAANQLQFALRDDAQQGSIFRVRGILNRIGVSPIVSDFKLKRVMQWSYGNDLAFLWFLMEAYYKTPGNTYSVNEQLILSIIAHLDMVSTLRALDHVLPPGNLSLRNIEKKRRRLEKQRQRALDMKNRMIKTDENVLPYFNPVPRMFPEHKSFRSFKPDIKIGTDIYEVYKDPTYEVRNEATRWYANYKLNIGNRFANTLLRQELEMVFGNMEELAGKDMADNLLQQQIKHILDPKTGLFATADKVVCKTHKDAIKDEDYEFHKKKLEERERCLKMAQFENKKQKARFNQLIGELDKDVVKYQSQSQARVSRVHDGSKINLLVLNKDQICDCKITPSPSFECVPPPPEEEQEPEGEEVEQEQEQDQEKEGTENKKGTNTKGGQSDRLQGGEDIEAMLKRYRSYMHSIMSSLMEVEHTPPSSQIFFETATPHKPYHFNYHKVFNFRNKDDINRKIREACVQELDGDLETAKRVDEVLPDLKHAAKECASKIWTKELEDCNDNYLSSSDSEHKKPCPKREQTNGIPQLDHYDCDDKELMSTMLKEGLRIIAKDTRYVLASIEDAYKLPILREWIYRRYGKTYSFKECKKLGELSMSILKALNTMEFTVTVPKYRVLGTKLQVKYTCKDYCLKKAAYHRQKFYDNFNNKIMNCARDYWFAMFPRICVKSPPKSMFFAYMPARVMDIYHFRPWLPGECMDAKAEWDKRRHMAKASSGN